MITTFKEWWKEIGQFIPPCDKLPEEEREVFRKFAEQLWEDDEFAE